jgi:hypothetical protein
MKRTKLTLSLPADVVEMLEKRVPKRKQSAFVADALRARFMAQEEAVRLQEMLADHQKHYRELADIEAELEPEDAILQSDGEIMDDALISDIEDLM